MPITSESGHFEGLQVLPSRDLPQPQIGAVIGDWTNNSPSEQTGLVQPDELRLKFPRNGIAMHGNYSYWRFSRRSAMDARLLRLTAKAERDRIPELGALLSARLRTKLLSNTLRRIVHHFYGVCLWFSLPLAVFASNGWLGLLSHGLAKTGAISLLEAPLSKPSTR